MSESESSAGKVSSLDEAKKKRDKLKIDARELKAFIALLAAGENEDAVDVIESHSIFERAAKLPEAYDQEISELLCQQFELHPAESHAFRKTIQGIRAESQPARKKKGRPEIEWARRQDYFDLFERVLGPLKKDIFSDRLHTQTLDGRWVPAINLLERVESLADECEHDPDSPRFRSSKIKAHFLEYEHQQKAVLIPEIPAWDGEDRIKKIAAHLELDGSQGFSQDAVEAFIKWWLAGVFRRIAQSGYQNRCLILIGPQGAGKDYLIEVLTGGFGQWATHFTIFANERDTQAQLHRAAVLKISEFDRTARTDVALLKHVITADHTNLREAYERSQEFRWCRCSFISSCNIADIFRDHTGHRRYLPLMLKGIRWGYPDSADDRRQILAQARAIHEAGAGLEPQHEQALRAYLEGQTPTSPEEDCIDSWCSTVQVWLQHEAPLDERREIESRGWVTNDEIRRYKLMAKVGAELGWKVKRVQAVLTRGGYNRRNQWRKGYSYETIHETLETSFSRHSRHSEEEDIHI